MFEDEQDDAAAVDVMPAAAVPGALAPAADLAAAGLDVAGDGHDNDGDGWLLVDDVEDPLLVALRLVERQAAGVFVAQAMALLALWEATADGGRGVGREGQVLAEAGVVLGLHELSVASRLAVALVMRDHPVLVSLLRSGGLGVAHVLVVAGVVGELGDPALADRVLASVLTAGGQLGWDGTPSQLRVALRRAVVRVDPVGAAQRRAEQAAARTGVRLRVLTEGAADWVVSGPAVQLTAADRLLSALSGPDGPDDVRLRGQRQLDALLGALQARVGSAVPVELQLRVPVRTGVAALPRGCHLPEPVVIVADLTPELLSQLQTGRADDPGPDDPGPGHPGHYDDPGPDEPGPGHSGYYDDPGPDEPGPGHPGYYDDPGPDEPGPGHPGHYDDPGPDDEPHVDPDDEPGPDDPGDRDRDRDLEGDGGGGRDMRADPAGAAVAVRALAVRAVAVRRPPRTLGVHELLGQGPLDPGVLAGLLTAPAGLPAGLAGLTIRRLCTDRTGQVVAVDASSSPLRTYRDATPAATLRQLTGGLATPPGTTAGYRPSAGQHRVVAARDTTCCFPGCRQPARRCDLDHRAAWPAGATSTANLHPLCRRHHRLKHDGWHPERNPDGSTVWTSPRGQRKRTTPE